jgi:hypothetical protein
VQEVTALITGIEKSELWTPGFLSIVIFVCQLSFLLRSCTLHNNQFNPSILNELSLKERSTFAYDLNNVEDEETKEKGKYVCFAYIGKETKFVTKLFIYINVQISYKTNNTI